MLPKILNYIKHRWKLLQGILSDKNSITQPFINPYEITSTICKRGGVGVGEFFGWPLSHIKQGERQINDQHLVLWKNSSSMEALNIYYQYLVLLSIDFFSQLHNKDA